MSKCSEFARFSICFLVQVLVFQSCITQNNLSQNNGLGTLEDSLSSIIDTVVSDDYFQPSFPKLETKVYNSNIKTAMLYKKGWPLSSPIIDLLSNQKLELIFDDLDADVKDYSYTIVHCDMNWQVSEIDPTDYINGFLEDEITDYEFSFNTMDDYTHFKLELPNENISFNYSGNYLLKVFKDQNKEDVVVSFRFMVVDSKVEVLPTVKQATLINDRNYKQEIDFTVFHEGYDVFDPYGEISVVIAQNGRWDNTKAGLSPAFVRENELVYDFEEENVFKATNEFRSFDFKSFRYKTEFIDQYTYDSTGQHVFLKLDDKRSFRRYFSKTDINGRYFIRNEDSNGDDAIESDYANVHFSLPFEAPIIDGNLYLMGGFTNWNFSSDFKLLYNYSKKAYEITCYLKQGYYEYAYCLLQDGKKEGDLTYIEGSHYETENEYCIYVYNTSLRNNYHQLIGVKNFGSRSR